MIDQEQFYLGHKRKHDYKFQLIVILDALVFSLIGSFIGRRGDWKMVELLELHEKLKAINAEQRPARALYLYGDLAYCTIYGIIEPYRNYLNRLRTLAQDKFNKVMARLRIEVEHNFSIHHNFWTWNSYHLQLKIR